MEAVRSQIECNYGLHRFVSISCCTFQDKNLEASKEEASQRPLGLNSAARMGWDPGDSFA